MQVAALKRHADRAGVNRELLRIVTAPDAPHSWRRPALTALGQMTDAAEVADALFVRLDETKSAKERAELIRALERSKTVNGELIQAITRHADDPSFRVRWAVSYALSRLQQNHKEARDSAVSVCTKMLADPWERIRADSAATLGARDDPEAER